MLKTGGKNRWAVFLLAGLLFAGDFLPTGEERERLFFRPRRQTRKARSQAEELAGETGEGPGRVSGVGKTKVLVTLN